MASPSADYEMLEELGSGSFGVVYKALERATGELVAIKHIDLDGTDDDIRDIQQEIALLSTCSSPFVTRYKTSFVRGVKLWIVMEFLGGGSCLDLVKIKPFDEAHAAIVCRELLLGLNYLHTSGKIHRDIKAANILLSNTGKVKIADFGVAAQLTNIKSQRMTFVGTPFWMAPEVIQEMGYDYKADIWSLGITAIELVNGAPPNADLHPMKALFHIPKNPAPRLEGTKFSRDMKSFVAACLVKDPDHRPSARDLLQHRFIQRAGRVDNLRSLILQRQQQAARQEEATHLKYYEETLKAAPSQETDDWVFDTVKPTHTVSAEMQQTIKKPKLSEIPAPALEPPSEMMQRMDIKHEAPATKDDPFLDQQDQPATVRLVQRQPSTARRMSPTKSPTKTNMPPPASPTKAVSPAKHVISASPAGSPKRTPSRIASPAARPVSRAGPLSRSPSKRVTSGSKQPLGVDSSFGNGNSSARHFRHISEDTSEVKQDENVNPVGDSETKEGKLGRRLFVKVIDPACQEIYAKTSGQAKLEAVSKVNQAWAALDALDAEGEFLLFKAMLEKMQTDPRLSQLLPTQQPFSSPTRQPSVLQSNSRPTTPVRTPSKVTKPIPNSKLIMAQGNPHLKAAHRRRDSAQVSVASGVSGMGGGDARERMMAEKELERMQALLPASRGGNGLEHTGQIADALYGKWLDGMRARWGEKA